MKTLPPLPRHPYMTWTVSEMAAIQSYGESCIAAYKASVSKRQIHRKFDDDQVRVIRWMHETGSNYKGINRTHPMSECTFINIIKRRGAYAGLQKQTPHNAPLRWQLFKGQGNDI